MLVLVLINFNLILIVIKNLKLKDFETSYLARLARSARLARVTRLARSARITKRAFERAELNISFKSSAREIIRALNFVKSSSSSSSLKARLELNELKLE